MIAYQTYKCRHGLFSHFDLDTTIRRSLELYGEWAEHEIYLFSRHIKAGSTVLDIGSNIGTHTIALSRIIGHEGTVYSLEAQHLIFQMLGMNILLNQACNVVALNSLVQNKLQPKYILYENASNGKNYGATSYKSDNFYGLKNSVPILGLTVDSLNLRKCDFIKIDVEGMELDVLRGAIDTIDQHRPYIYFEQNNRKNFAEIFLNLKAKGYSLYWHVSNPFNKNNFNNHNLNIFGGTCEVNIFAVPNTRELNNDPLLGLMEIDSPIYNPVTPEYAIGGWALPAHACDPLCS